MATQWVIREESRIPKTGKPMAFWWFGPNHGWGRTWGGAREAHKFRTRKEAETAFRDEFGIRVAWKPQKLDDAVAEYDARIAAYKTQIEQDAS